MKRRELGDALAIALQQTGNDIEESAVIMQRLIFASLRVGPKRKSRHHGASAAHAARRREFIVRCEAVAAEVAVDRGLNIHQIRSDGQHEDLVAARGEVIWRCRQELRAPWSAIEPVVLRDRSTMIHAFRKAEAARAQAPACHLRAVG